MKRLNCLFELLSDATGFDFPLCHECTRYHYREMRQQARQLSEQTQAYSAQLLRFQAQQSELQHQHELYSAQLREEREHNAELKRRLNDVNEHMECLRIHHAKAHQREQALHQLEEEYCQQSAEFSLATARYLEEEDAFEARLVELDHINNHLRKVNVLNDCFHIWHDGHFGTINGLRLGRFSECQVEWPEINAAWGLACLLLFLLSNKLSCTFSRYRLIPMGSMSRIEVQDGSVLNSYQLYGSGEITFSNLFWFRSFDSAMIAFLECVFELELHIQRLDMAFHLPYMIEDDVIGGVSIKMHNTIEWSRALKFLLTNLKWIVSWTAKHEDSNTIERIDGVFS